MSKINDIRCCVELQLSKIILLISESHPSFYLTHHEFCADTMTSSGQSNAKEAKVTSSLPCRSVSLLCALAIDCTAW